MIGGPLSLEAMRRQTASDAKSESDLVASSMELLDTMSAIDFRHYGMVVVPSSCFSAFDDHLERALGVAFNDVIFSAVDHGLKRRAEALLANSSYRVETAQGATTFVPSGTNETELLAAATIVPVDRMPEFIELKR